MTLPEENSLPPPSSSFSRGVVSRVSDSPPQATAHLPPQPSAGEGQRGF